ncbi:hypothetical protein D3C76_1565240 [compost metagenome]
MNTPMAYRGIRFSVYPLETTARTPANRPNTMMPLEKPSRSPRIIKAWGMNLSLASIKAKSGNAAYAVLAARNRIRAVVP